MKTSNKKKIKNFSKYKQNKNKRINSEHFGKTWVMQQLEKFDLLSALLVAKVKSQGYPWAWHQHPPSCCFHRSQASSSSWRPPGLHLAIHKLPCYIRLVTHEVNNLSLTQLL